MAKQAAAEKVAETEASEPLEKFEARSDGLAKLKRPGWSFLVPGELLKIGSKMWSDEQRANGITLGCVFLTADEEKRGIGDAIAEGNPGTVVIHHVKISLKTVDGALVDYSEKDLVWEALGPHGRTLAADLYSRALSPDKEAVAKARASFRLTA